MTPMTLKPSSYVLKKASDDIKELERLDEMHAGFSDFFSQELSLSDLGNPKRILELGAGSGAWAIQAAKKYPASEVVAVDISPFPNRPVPGNLKFEQLDLRDDLPFAPGTFDIVHMRLVLVHLPDVPDTLRRIIDLVKSGGWVLIEEIDHMYCEPTGIGEATERLLRIVNDAFQARGNDPRLGISIEPLLRDINLFRYIRAERIRCPISSESTADLRLRLIGQSIRRSFTKAYATVLNVYPGFTEEVMQAWQNELEDRRKSYTMNLYVVSAQKL